MVSLRRTARRGCGRRDKESYLVAVVGDELEEVEGVIGCVHLQVLLPSQLGLFVHNVAPAQPAQVAVAGVVGVRAFVSGGMQSLINSTPLQPQPTPY